MASSRSLSEVLWAWYRTTRTWPTSKERALKEVKKGGDIRRLEDYLRSHAVIGIGGALPKWAIDYLASEVGSFAAYLKSPELAPVIVQAAAEGWTPDKLQARIERTSYYQKTTQKQRQYDLLTNAEKKQSADQYAVWVMETVNAIWGPEMARKRGYTLGSAKVRTWAKELSSGKQTEEMFTYSHERAAEGWKGTPAHTALLEEYRRAGAAEVEQEDIRGELEEQWRAFVGDQVKAPNLKAWAENIYMNRRSRQDFEDYLQAVGNNLYPTKPEFVSYADWVAPHKQIIGDYLELGRVDDGDPILQAFVRGEVTSLSETLNRVRRDPRHQWTERARDSATNAAMTLLQKWGVR